MKRKIIILTGFFFLLRFFCLPEISFAVTVADLYPAAKVLNEVAGSITVPAAIEAVGTAGVFQKTVALVLDNVTLGNVAATVLLAGAAYGVGKYVDWLMQTDNPHLQYNSAGNLVKLVPSVVPPPCVAHRGYQNYLGNFSDQDEAYNTVRNTAAALEANHGAITSNDGFGETFEGCMIYGSTAHYTDYTGGAHLVTVTYVTTFNAPITTESIEVPANNVDVAVQLIAGVLAHGAAAIGAAKNAVDHSASIYPPYIAPAGTKSLQGTSYDAVLKALYNGAVTAGDAAAAQAGADAVTPDENAAAAATQATSALTQAQLTAALQAAGLTATQIAAAVAAASGAQTVTDVNTAVVSALQTQGLSATQIAAAIAAVSAVQGLTQAQAQAAVAAALAAGHLSAAEIAFAIYTAFPGVTAAQLASALATAKVSASDIAAAIKTANPELTQDQIQAAVAAALTATLGSDVTPPDDTPIVIPDKKNLSTVMGAFMTAINRLPLMQTLHGLTINCVGTSSLCINLPNNLGGNQCFDVGPATGSINMVGQALLSITTLFMFVWIFKG